MTTFDRIKNISKKKGYSSLRVLSETAGLGPNAIYQWRDKTPRTDNLQAVADVLGVSVDYLLGNTDDMHSIQKDDEPIDLYTVTDDERDRMISANGQPISDEDWAIIKAVLARYPKRD
ncbi:helix-turn-helix domain-containing protein [Weissella thailandensis]|uniref:XRE family transcriptional regulator n=1 Tax=Weissella thailandensis TaxID=89061 RepID=A0ABX9I8E1_9LACO|nr:helix-turn-helix transcriptional regulator [Weissella thailandensis]NKY90343.1 helix-turn-helix transcriptional regulator [Weissella thailandensis]RDS60428.1 XRE family transcriptional regulator [Weissella thailandensis]GEP75294.1 transcriptional regulator [Weissella thailandensis]